MHSFPTLVLQCVYLWLLTCWECWQSIHQKWCISGNQSRSTWSREKIKQQCSRIPMESLLEIPYLFSLFMSLFKLVTSQGNRMKVVIKFVDTLVQTVLHENRKHSLVMNIEFWCCSWNVFANSECSYMRPCLPSSTTLEWTWIKTTWWYIDSNQSNSEQGGYMHVQLS